MYRWRVSLCGHGHRDTVSAFLRMPKLMRPRLLILAYSRGPTSDLVWHRLQQLEYFNGQ